MKRPPMTCTLASATERQAQSSIASYLIEEDFILLKQISVECRCWLKATDNLPWIICSSYSTSMGSEKKALNAQAAPTSRRARRPLWLR